MKHRPGFKCPAVLLWPIPTTNKVTMIEEGPQSWWLTNNYDIKYGWLDKTTSMIWCNKYDWYDWLDKTNKCEFFNGRARPAIQKFTARMHPAIEFLRLSLESSTDYILTWKTSVSVSDWTMNMAWLQLSAVWPDDYVLPTVNMWQTGHGEIVYHFW